MTSLRFTSCCHILESSLTNKQKKKNPVTQTQNYCNQRRTHLFRPPKHLFTFRSHVPSHPSPCQNHPWWRKTAQRGRSILHMGMGKDETQFSLLSLSLVRSWSLAGATLLLLVPTRQVCREPNSFPSLPILSTQNTFRNRWGKGVYPACQAILRHIPAQLTSDTVHLETASNLTGLGPSRLHPSGANHKL